MFNLKIYNPFKQKMDTITTLSVSSEEEAKAQAQEFLFSNGIKLGEIVPVGTETRITIIGIPDQGSVATDTGGFWFVANHIYFVFKTMKEVMGLKVDSFIDLGCGTGNILINAHNLLGSQRLVGVELDPALVEQAKRYTAALGAEIIEADLLKWTPALNDYDMVYAYDPIRDLELRAKFQASLAGWLRDGQYVFYHRIVGEMPDWLEMVEIPDYDVPCLYTFNKEKVEA